MKGGGISGIIGYPMCAWIAAEFGWDSVFYTTGTIGIIWFMAYFFLVYSNPDEHPRISKVNLENYDILILSCKFPFYFPKEYLAYVKANVAHSTGRKDLPFPPLSKIVTNSAYFAILAASMAHTWVSYTLLTSTPTYFNNIQHLSLEMVIIYLGQEI